MCSRRVKGARDLVVISLVAGAIALVARKKTAATASGPRTCKQDDECVLSCEPKGDCCHDPYCERAMHRDDADEARAYNAKHCTSEDHAKCPVIGARVPPDYCRFAASWGHLMAIFAGSWGHPFRSIMGPPAREA